MSVIRFQNAFLKESASVVGKIEGEGPLGNNFDFREDDAYFGEDSWEQAETAMVCRTVNLLLSKNVSSGSPELLLGGDLLNQCTATGFAANTLSVPFLGLYGACSTIAEALLTAGVFLTAGAVKNAVCVASSHFCSSERQFRFPLEYGCQRTPTSQRTVTGAGAFYMEQKAGKIALRSALIGKVQELGVTDANNMGAAMAPAAVDSITRYFAESGETPASFDIITTGDLGREGYEIACELMKKKGFDAGGRFTDSGMLIYDFDKQNVDSGGSGCGCLACVTSALFLKKLLSGEAKKIMLVGTGALLSPKSVQQKLPIPAVAHLVVLEKTE